MTQSPNDQEQIKTRTSADGATIVYRLRQSRNKRLLLLIHGMASNLTRWSEFVEATRLKETWDILRLDLRGHGLSTYRGRLTLETWCRDLISILDKEGYGEAVLVGHSLGAQIAIHFASLYPDHTAGLVLIDPVFHTALSQKMRWVYRLRALMWPVIGLVRLLNSLGIYRRSIPQRDLRKLDEQTRKKFLNVGKEEEMVSQYSSPWPDIKHFPVGNYLQEFIITISPLPDITDKGIPLLAVLASSPTFTDAHITKDIINRFPESKIVEVHAYHWPLTEQPIETREAIENWCNATFGNQ